MPFIQVAAQEGLLSKEERQDLMKRLSDAIIRAEGADPSEPSAQAMAWGHYHDLPKGDLFVYGEVVDAPPVHVSFTTPEGLLTDATRDALTAEVNTAVDDILGAYEGRMNHWVILHEVPSGQWGGMGQVFPTDAIKAVMKVPA
ncbi:MAG: hypothetical protein AAGD35_06260 [Actinomycetota bacterium]